MADPLKYILLVAVVTVATLVIVQTSNQNYRDLEAKMGVGQSQTINEVERIVAQSGEDQGAILEQLRQNGSAIAQIAQGVSENRDMLNRAIAMAAATAESVRKLQEIARQDRERIRQIAQMAAEETERMEARRADQEAFKQIVMESLRNLEVGQTTLPGIIARVQGLSDMASANNQDIAAAMAELSSMSLLLSSLADSAGGNSQQLGDLRRHLELSAESLGAAMRAIELNSMAIADVSMAIAEINPAAQSQEEAEAIQEILKAIEESRESARIQAEQLSRIESGMQALMRAFYNPNAASFENMSESLFRLCMIRTSGNRRDCGAYRLGLPASILKAMSERGRNAQDRDPGIFMRGGKAL